MRKIILHFFDEDSAMAFKKSWEAFKSKNYGSIEQKGNICIIYYACNKVGVCSPAPNSIFRGCQHCG